MRTRIGAALAAVLLAACASGRPSLLRPARSDRSANSDASAQPQLPAALRQQPRAATAQSLLTARGPLAAAARLRGGNALEAVQQAYLNLPLGTRCWSSLIGTLAVLSQIGLLQPEQVAVDAHAIVKQLQIWRPVTAASFLGGLGPQLIQKLYYLISYGRQLEATLGLGEYLRVLASLAAALTFLFHVLGWQFTADGMIMGITVLCAQQMPDAQISLYGLNIPYAAAQFSAQFCAQCSSALTTPLQVRVPAVRPARHELRLPAAGALHRHRRPPRRLRPLPLQRQPQAGLSDAGAARQEGRARRRRRRRSHEEEAAEQGADGDDRRPLRRQRPVSEAAAGGGAGRRQNRFLFA